MSVIRRAYARLEIKSVDDQQRIIEGTASTPSTDRMGDIVEPDGCEYTLPLPFLWQHDSDQPIGQVLAAKVTAAGIYIKAQIAKGVLPQIDNAWALIKAGLVRGLSIGFNPLEMSDIVGTYGTRFTKWEWLELSAVTIPANQDASIQAIKSCDVGAASARPVMQLTAPGVTGAPSRIVTMRHQDRTMKKTLTEQITTWEQTRAAKAARQTEIQQKALDEGRAKNAEEKEEFDNLEAELKSIDSEIVDLRAMEAREKSAAAPVRGGSPTDGSHSRSTGVRVINRPLDKGIAFARYAMCVAASKGSMSDAMSLARRHYPDSGLDKYIEAQFQKTAVGAGAADVSHWADDLVPYNVLDDFIEYLRPGSVIGKFGGPNPGGGPDYPGLRRVPFNVRVSGFSAGTSGNWVGEGLPAALSKATSFNTTLPWAKVAALAVLTKEEIRFSNPSAEAKVRDDLARAINTRLDVDFIDPAKAVSANVSPASITNGVAAVAPTAATAAGLITDLQTLLKQFTTNNLDTSDVVLLMSASQALSISLMTTTLGFPYFPDINVNGGRLRGLPVIASENLQGVGSPSTNSIVAVKASDVYLADDGVVTLEASDQASLEMSDAPAQSGTSGSGASMVSLWQSGLLGLKAEREITWKMRRSTAVGYISPAAYSA